MKEIIAFFKEIFMISDEGSNFKTGLSQFKDVEKEPEAQPVKIEKDIKLSDLMRRSA